MIKKMFGAFKAQRDSQRDAELYRNLIRHEARIGGTLFGPVPKGGRREFFCLDEHTWVWHEEWTDKGGSHLTKTTRYDMRSNGILKAQDGQQYQQVTQEEARNLFQAIETYLQRVRSEIYAQI